MSESKSCRKCKIIKNLDDFFIYKHYENKKIVCRECINTLINNLKKKYIEEKTYYCNICNTACQSKYKLKINNLTKKHKKKII